MTTEILCRLDKANNVPVVFDTDSIQNNMIRAWTRDGGAKMVPLDFYHTTGALSAADERVLANAFAQATNRTAVKVRQRLPRTAKELPTLFANNGNAPQATAPAAAAQQAGVVIVPKTAPKKAAPTVQKRRGRPAAKPIEAQVPAQAVAQMTPDEVMQELLNMRAHLDALASKLMPKQG